MPLVTLIPVFFIMEEWRDITGYEGYYQISSFGNARSVNRTVKVGSWITRRMNGRLLIKMVNQGYFNVNLCQHGVPKTIRVHRLVALTFIPNPKNKPSVNHKNGDRYDNRVENPEWVTPSENLKHASENGLLSPSRGENHGGSKLNEFQVRVIKKCNDLYGRELGEVFNITAHTIHAIKAGRIWKHVN